MTPPRDGDAVSVINRVRRPSVPDARAVPEASGLPRHIGRPSHRRDIDGLRAIAVGLVVLYHAGLPFLPGGYVGVDVFFVISGFLITGLLLSELQRTGTVNIRSFYARRVRRLLPASATVLVATMIVAHLVMAPLTAEGVDGDAVAAALYVANWLFAAQTSDYFAAQADASPLLHYWSLSVEEQFYVVWPLLILGMVALTTVLGRRGRRTPSLRTRIAVGLAIVGGLSFLLSATLTPMQPGWSYYGLHTRAWELAVGAGLAIAAPYLPLMPRGVAVLAGWLGLGLILLSAFTFDEATPFPGTLALMPVLGAALVLASGARERRGGAPRLLSEKGFVHIGLLSYSWYLWHWPALVFARHLTSGPTDGDESQSAPLWAIALAVVASYGLARLTTRYIETPVRTSRSLAGNIPRSLAIGAVLTAVPVVVALLPLPGPVVVPSQVPSQSYRHTTGVALVSGSVCTDGPENPCLAAETRLESLPDTKPHVTARVAAEDYVRDMGQCHRSFGAGDPADPCQWGDPNGETTIVLVGDSKAQQWLPALDSAGSQRGWKIYAWTRSSCPFADVIMYLDRVGGRYSACEQWRDQVQAKIAALATGSGVDLVLVGRSRAYPGMLMDESGARIAADQTTSLWRAGVEKSIAALGPVKHVALMRDIPWSPQEIPTCLSANPGKSSNCAFLAAVDVHEAQLAAGEREIAAGDELVRSAQPSAIVCPEDVCRAVTEDGTVVYRDGHHLTTTFARSQAGPFGDLVEQLLHA